MNSRHVLSTIVFLLLTGPVFALCKTGTTANCSVNGKPGTRTCLGSGRFGPCEASPKTSPTGPAPLPANYIGEANDTNTVFADAKAFFDANFGDTDVHATATVSGYFLPTGVTPAYWGIGQQTSALVQMYDLLLPLDPARARPYLDRLHLIAAALLANRDDRRQVSAPGVQTSEGHPIDAFRGRVMKAWGAIADDRDNKWNTDVSTTGLFTYAMAAFARRVADNPAAYPQQYTTDAVHFATAALESYAAFQPEQHLTPGDPWAYFTLPTTYKNLQCKNGDSTIQNSCTNYKNEAGQALAYNENLSMMKALAEAALAADSALYRNSPDGTPANLSLATNMAPLLIAKNFTYYDKHLTEQSLSDGTPIFKWQHQQPAPSLIQNTAHGGLELGVLAVLLDDKIRLNAVLAKSGQTVQVALSTPLFTRFANTFLRKIWHYDFQNANGIRNVLSADVDGGGYLGLDQGKSANWECAGWIPLAQFEHWMWIRCRDSTFRAPGFLRVDNWAALLRYRQYLYTAPP
jgi:hypothetical protein